MPNARFYSSIAAATALQVTVAPSDTSIQVASSVGWPGSFPFTLSLDYGSANEELVDVVSGGPSVFTVTRAVDGTSASTHNAGAVVRHVSSARDFTDFRTHEAASSGVHGISGSFVDTVSVQTLTNKTLTAPSITNPTITGTATMTGATVANGTYTGSTMTTPTINGATITGTVAGTPTHSGLTTFSAGIVTEGETVQKVNGTDTAITVKRDADSGLRLKVTADGGMGWTDGTTSTPDVSLFRSSSGNLSITGSLTASSALSSATLSTTGNATVGGALTTTGNTTVGNDLSVGGIGKVLFAYKTGDTTRNNTAAVTDDPDLQVTVNGNCVYEVNAYIVYNSNTTADFQMAFNTPAFGSGSYSAVGWGRDATASVGTGGWTVRMNENTISQTRTFGGDTTDITLHAKGILRTGAGLPGTFTFAWGQAAADPSNTIVRANSYITLRRVA